MKHDFMFRRVHQVAVPAGRQTTTVFGWVHQTMAWGEACCLRFLISHEIFSV